MFIGAGFTSKSYFGSGYFKMKIKLPANDSGGLVTAFYVPTNTLNLLVNVYISIYVYKHIYDVRCSCI